MIKKIKSDETLYRKVKVSLKRYMETNHGDCLMVSSKGGRYILEPVKVPLAQSLNQKVRDLETEIAVQKIEIKELRGIKDKLDATANKLGQAFGYISGIKSDMEIRPDDPMGMAKELVNYVENMKTELNAKVDLLDEARKGLYEAKEKLKDKSDVLLWRKHDSYYHPDPIIELREGAISGSQFLQVWFQGGVCSLPLPPFNSEEEEAFAKVVGTKRNWDAEQKKFWLEGYRAAKAAAK